MKLLRLPLGTVEYPLELRLKTGRDLEFTVRHPGTSKPVTRFQPVHEKLFHLFVVSQDLEFFAHEHPRLDRDGRFRLSLQSPAAGLHRMLADFYPEGGVPQMISKSIILPGTAPAAAGKAPSNLQIELVTVPPNPTPGVKTMLFFRVSPAEGLELYLGAWGHLFSASDDLIDLIHTHPFAAKGGEIQFNLIFPRPRTYRVWAQFQRNGLVNTARFDVPVRPLSDPAGRCARPVRLRG